MTKVDSLNEFIEDSSSILDDFLSEYGFDKVQNEVDENFATIVYRNSGRYIRIHASNNPLDYPYRFNLSLGKGEHKMPERDWNSIALWQIKKKLKPESQIAEYTLGDKDHNREQLLLAKKELEEFGVSFLKGELALFEKILIEINQNREPYKVHFKKGGESICTKFFKRLKRK